MKTAIFVGPTLPKATVQKLVPDALLLGPAVQGDVDFAVRQLGADTIALIDGVHRSKLPTWHAEILSALAEPYSVRVLGAASMGALRAVECHPWGAEPVGEVASWYSSGKIDGDDEVCLAHEDAARGYRHLSVPLVNVRATLISCNLPTPRKREILLAAKEMFYPDRTWEKIHQVCEIRGAELLEITSNQLDIKAADALHLCHLLESLPPRPTPERKVLNSDYGYSAVFRSNDSVTLARGKAIRMYQIAGDDPHVHRLAGYRALALEYCKLIGITPRVWATEEDNLPQLDDDSPQARIDLANGERAIDRAREWLSSSRANFGDVHDVTDFLRTQGLYQKRKGSL